MKKIIYSLLLCLSAYNLSASEASNAGKPAITQKTTPAKKKIKILILTSNGGGGQVSVNLAIREILGNLDDLYDYETVSTLFFPEVANKVDPVSWFTFGYYSGEDLYNYWQKKGYFGVLQSSSEFSRWYYYALSPFVVSQTANYIEKVKPDLVISIIPIVNNIIAKACARNKVPLLIIPPDFDIAFYTQDLRLKKFKENVFIALPFDNDLSRQSIQESKKAYKSIKKENIFSFQYPLRQEFYEKKDINSIKKDFSINDKNPVILLMMGAQGNNSLYSFAQQIAKIQDKAHLFICTGKYEAIIPKLKSLYFPPNLTVHILGYTNRVSDLMAISDLMISKTGAISVVESLYSRLPIIADQTEYVVSWELFHQKFIEKNKTGFILKNIKNLPAMITDLLKNPKKLKEAKSNIDAILKTQPKNGIESIIKKIIDETLSLIIDLKRDFDQQQQIRQGIRIAIVGSVNAGKSSLFNAILKKDRAIVTEIAGTTRDVIEAGLYRENNYWTLIDTAGIRQQNRSCTGRIYQ